MTKHYESYQEKDKMLIKVLDENGNITNTEMTKKEVHEKRIRIESKEN